MLASRWLGMVMVSIVIGVVVVIMVVIVVAIVVAVMGMVMVVVMAMVMVITVHGANHHTVIRTTAIIMGSCRQAGCGFSARCRCCLGRWLTACWVSRKCQC